MKNKFLLLVKTSFLLTFNPKKMFTRQNKPASKGKSFLYAVLMIFMFGYFMFLSSLAFYSIGNQLKNTVYIDFLLYVAIIAYTSFILLITIFSAQGYLYKSKDLPLLLSLPVTHFTVLLSKFMILYIYELFFAILVMVPAFFFYFYFTAITTLGIVFAVLCLLATPLIPLSIGSLLSYFIGLATRRMQKKNLITIVLTLFFVVAYMFAVQNGNKILAYIMNNSDTLQKAFSKFYFPSFLLVGSIKGNPLYTLLFLLTGAAVVMVVFSIISQKYADIVTTLNSTGSRKKYKVQQLGEQSSTALSAMIKKELSCYFSSANYVLNTIMGPLLLLIGSVALLFMDPMNIAAITGMTGIQNMGLVLACGMTAMLPSLAPTTSSVISLEGKKLWIYKSIPASTKDILKAKTAVNLIVTVPEIIISGILLCIALHLNVFDYLVIISSGILFTAVFSLTGILINLSHPKLDFENETIVVKQSMSVILQMLLSFGTIIATVIIFSFIKPDNFYIFAIVVLAVIAFFIFILQKRLYTWGVRKFNELV